MNESVYFGRNSELLRKAESQLKLSFDSLKEVLEDRQCERPENITRSIPLPKDFSYFGLERENLIKRTLKVPIATTGFVDEASRLLDSALNSDYSLDSLPLLLHQHYTDRCDTLQMMEYLLMEGWKNSSKGETTKEGAKVSHAVDREKFKDVERKVRLVRVAYEQCRERTGRLGPSRESYLTKDSHNLLTSVEPDDLLDYLRFMVQRFTMTRKLQQFLMIIQWLPVSLEFEEMAEDTMQSLARDNTDDASGESQQDEHQFTGSRCLPTKVKFGGRRNRGFVGGKELKERLKALVDEYDVRCDVDSISYVGEETSLCEEVVRVFKEEFQRQEKLDCFKANTDRPKSNDYHPFVALDDAIGREELGQVRFMTRLRSANRVDPLLENMSVFLRHSDFEKVLRSLKSHVSELKKQVPHKSLNLDGDGSKVGSTTSRRSRDKNRSNQLEEVFMTIYTDPGLLRTPKEDSQDIISRSLALVSMTTNHHHHQQQQQHWQHDEDGFDPVKLLGLDAKDHESSDPSTTSGALLSYHLLRHIRTRHFRRQCHDIIFFLNCCKSRLTSDSLRESTATKHFSVARLRDESCETSVGFERIRDEDCMGNGFCPVATETEDGFKSEVAWRDFDSLEHDLLLVGSHYIERSLLRDSPSSRKESCINKINNHNNHNNVDETTLNFDRETSSMDFSYYGRSEVDRFEVLLHLWSCQAAFLTSLKKLIEFYLDCYLQTCNKTDRRFFRNLLLQLTAVRLPSFGCERDDDDDDDGEEYFYEYFHLDTKSIRLETSLMEKIRDDLLGNLSGRDDRVAVNQTDPLSSLHLFHHAIRRSFRKTMKGEGTTSAICRLRSKVTFHEKVVEAWSGMDVLGSSFSAQVQQDLFNGSIMDDPDLVCNLIKSYTSSPENQPSRKSVKEKHLHALTSIANMMDLVTVRHRMLEAAWQTELFVKIYRKLSLALRMEECNLHLRPMGFEYARSKVRFGPPVCSLSTNYAETYSSILDRFIPNSIVLSIHELDELQVGKFSFLAREHIFQLIKNKSSFENVRISLAVQLATNRLFVCSFRKVVAIRNYKRIFSVARNNVPENRQSRASPTKKIEIGNDVDASQSLQGKLASIPEEMANELGEKTGDRKLGMKIPFIPKIAANQEPDESRTQDENITSKRENPVECGYLSIQLEKAFLRDHMLECFLKSCRGVSELLKNPDDFQKVKRKYILEYCKDLNKSVFIHECTIKIIELNTSISRLLKSFPLLRKFFEPLSELRLTKEESKQPSKQDLKDQTSPSPKPPLDVRHGDESNGEEAMISDFDACLETINDPWLLLSPSMVHRLSQRLCCLSSSIIQLENPPPSLLSLLTPRVTPKRSSGKITKITGATKPQPGDPELTSPFVTSLNSCHVRSIFGNWLETVQSVNDIICTLCSLASVGGTRGNAEKCKWGSPESIATEINEIKTHLHFFQCNVCQSSSSSSSSSSSKSNNNNPKAIEFLALYRDTLLLKFQTLIDIQVGGAIKKMRRSRKMVTTETLEMYQRLKNQVLQEFGIMSSPSSSLSPFHLECTFLPLPDVVADSDLAASKIYPWRNVLLTTKDDSPDSSPFVWPKMKNIIHLCFAGFTDEEMKLANAELTSLSLALQDVAGIFLDKQPTNQNDKKGMPSTPLPITEGEEEEQEATTTNQDPPPGGQATNRTSPIEIRAEMKRFLQMMNQLQKVKRLWAETRFERNKHKQALIRNVYKRDILEPLAMNASKEKTLPTRSSGDGDDVDDDDDDDDDVKEIIHGGDDDMGDDDDNDAYAKVKEVMTIAEFVEKQMTRLLEDTEFQMIEQSRRIMKMEASIIMGREFGGGVMMMMMMVENGDADVVGVSAGVQEQTWPIEGTICTEDARVSMFPKLLRIFTKRLETEARQNVDLLASDDSVPPTGSDETATFNGHNNLGRRTNGETGRRQDSKEGRNKNVVDVDDDSVVNEMKPREIPKTISDVFGSNDIMIIKRSTYQESCMNLTSAVLGLEESCSKVHNKTMTSCLARIQQLEQENEQLKKRLIAEKESRETEMVCNMADRFGDLAVEVAALRHKVAELEVASRRRDDEMRKRISREYEASFKRIVASLLASERTYNQQRLQYCNDVFHQINEARKEAMDGLARLSLRMSLRIDADPHGQQQLQRHRDMTERLQEVQNQNADVETKCHLLRAFNLWKIFCAENKTEQKIEGMKRTIEISLRDRAKLIGSFEKEKFILKEQLSALRKAFASLRNEHEIVKKTLDRETKEKSINNHTLEQKILSVKQVEEACINKIKELNAEVGTKEDLVARLTEDLQKTKGLKALLEERLKRDVDDAKRKLKRERTLKLDAFQEVNRLLGEMQTVGDSNADEVTWAGKQTPSSGLRTSTSAKRAKDSANQSRSKQTNLRCKSAFVRRCEGGRISEQQHSEGKPSAINLSFSQNLTQIQVTTLIADQIFDNRGPPSQNSLVRAKSANHFAGKTKPNINREKLKYLRPTSNFYKSSFL